MPVAPASIRREIRRRALGLLGVAALLLAACGTPPTNPDPRPGSGSAPSAPLIPARQFVANTSFQAHFKLSPDGQWLAWLGASGTDASLQVAPADTLAPVRPLATRQIPRSAQPHWAHDSRHLVYSVDTDGSENTALWSVDRLAPDQPARQVTPWGPDVRAVLANLGPAGSSQLYVVANARDRAVFDLYRVDAAHPGAELVKVNDRRITQWIFDEHGHLAGWQRVGAQGLQLEVLDQRGEAREVLKVPPRDSLRVVQLHRARGELLALSNIARDKLALVRLDLRQTEPAAGATLEVLAQDERVDLDSVMADQTTGRLLAALSMPDFPRSQWLDSTLEVQLAALWRSSALPRPITIKIVSSARDGGRMVLRPVTALGEGELLWDRQAGSLRVLRPLPVTPGPLVPVEPISVSTADGLTLHGYLLRPKENASPWARAPLVVQVHGGPWARDVWTGGLGTQAQFLANRGYAVLMINYRGSAGYGKAFMEAGVRQLGRATQDDIAAAVRWALERGIAEPGRIAVTGASFGGYSTLMQLIREPELYACGISQVGVANLPRLLDNAPPYWRDALPMWRRYVGDARRPDERLRMLAESPVSQLDRIRVPLLVIHGKNDVRVARQDSEDVVEALRARGAAVEYLLLDNEGHTVRDWRNQLLVWRRTEAFLARCLGGRTGGPEPLEPATAVP